MSTVNIGGKARIQIDGRDFVGQSISIINGRVKIDGQPVDGQVSGVVSIKIEGTLHHLETDAAVTAGAITGNVTAGGSVRCEHVGGSVQAGGSVEAGNVSGGIMAGGSVRHR